MRVLPPAPGCHHGGDDSNRAYPRLEWVWIFYKKVTNAKDILWARKDHHASDFVLQEQQDAARLSSFEEWYSALGHVSPACVSANCYTDGQPIPSAPKNFEFYHCTISRSTKFIHQQPLVRMPSVPTDYCTLTYQASSQYNLSENRITTFSLLDRTSFASERFLREKSDAIKCIKGFVKERTILRFRAGGGSMSTESNANSSS